MCQEKTKEKKNRKQRREKEKEEGEGEEEGEEEEGKDRMKTYLLSLYLEAQVVRILSSTSYETSKRVLHAKQEEASTVLD